ncbi:twin-arginine translocation signal domain-containing protein [Nostoc sp.]|uniref:twin-arginine translocation signal domain-containing protein n=1 Tax=Nostoc sp. TaxID=1180 RepID=UPI003FA5C9FF
MENNTTTRRSFLKASGALGAGLFLWFYLPPSSRVQAATSPVNQTKPLSKPNAFIRILPDNTRLLYIKLKWGKGFILLYR